MKLLDAWKAKMGAASDNAAAIKLGVQRQAISRWRAGLSHASPTYAARMAQDLGMDELRVLASIEADRAYNGEDKRVWQKHGRSAFMALLVGLSVGLSPAGRTGDLRGMGSLPHPVTPEVRPLCEVPNWRRRRRYQRPRMAA